MISYKPREFSESIPLASLDDNSEEQEIVSIFSLTPQTLPFYDKTNLVTEKRLHHRTIMNFIFSELDSSYSHLDSQISSYSLDYSKIHEAVFSLVKRGVSKVTKVKCVVFEQDQTFTLVSANVVVPEKMKGYDIEQNQSNVYTVPTIDDFLNDREMPF